MHIYGFNTFTSFHVPSRDMLVEHALRMRSVVWQLYDGWAVHIRRKVCMVVRDCYGVMVGAECTD